MNTENAPNASEFKNALIKYFHLKNDERITSFLRDANIILEFYSHDSWDGGFDIYDLNIESSLEAYVTHEDYLSSFREKINFIAQQLLPGNDTINSICISIKTNNTLLLINKELLDTIDAIKILLISKATGQHIDTEQETRYKEYRKKLLNASEVNAMLPSFVKSCSNLNEFWSYIQPKFKTYKERRTFIYKHIDHLISTIIHQQKNPIQTFTMPTLSKLNSDSVRDTWIKSMNRLTHDPEGAITSARTLLEDVIKNILNDLKIPYSDENDNLPKLYELVTEALNLSPAQHLELVFKQILGGCKSVVYGLSALRNKVGDAHASGKRPVKPGKRHAELAVNLSGTMATYLVASWEFKKVNCHEIA